MAGRESDTSDFIGNDPECFGIGADKAHGACGIGMSCPASARTPVFQEEAAESVIVEPSANISAFVIPCEDLISAAGADENGGMGTFPGSGEECDRWIGHIGEPFDVIPVCGFQVFCFFGIIRLSERDIICVPKGIYFLIERFHDKSLFSGL